MKNIKLQKLVNLEIILIVYVRTASNCNQQVESKYLL